MSPTPLIELQRRLAPAGRIRMGEKGDKGQPKRLNTFRITSPDESLVMQAAGLYGGKPEPWDSPTGPQFEVVTTSAELPVLVMPGYSFSQSYELRTSPTLVERRCDGIEMADGSPCACNAAGEDRCELMTRLTVALPELTTMLGWLLVTKGDNAAKELLGSMDLVRGVAGGRPFVPAKLRIVERRGNVNGQAVRYVVPVIDVQVRYAEVLGGEGGRERAALPAGYIPIEAPKANGGTSLAEAIVETEAQTITRTSRSAAPIPAADLSEFGGAPLPAADAGASSSPQATSHPVALQDDASAPPSGNTYSRSTRDKPATGAQKDKMNVLVGKLRPAKITTEHLWAALAQTRNIGADDMIALLEGRDAEGVLHWSPLRESLTRGESHDLIDRLTALEAKP